MQDANEINVPMKAGTTLVKDDGFSKRVDEKHY